MRRFREVLKPDGVLCLSVPNMQSIDRKFKRLLKRLGLKRDKWQPWRTPDHLYEPDEKSMRAFFERQGFELIRTYSYPSEWLGGFRSGIGSFTSGSDGAPSSGTISRAKKA